MTRVFRSIGYYIIVIVCIIIILFKATCNLFTINKIFKMKNNSSIFLLLLYICLVISYWRHLKNDSLDIYVHKYYTQSQLFNKYADSVMYYQDKSLFCINQGDTLSSSYYEGKAMAFWTVSKFALDSSRRVKK